MDSPMFSQPENEVIAMFDTNGSLMVKFNQELNKDQFKQFNYGVSAAVAGVARADYYTPTAQGCEIMICLRPNQVKRAFDIRRDVQSYTTDFLARLTPAAQQATLF